MGLKNEHNSCNKENPSFSHGRAKDVEDEMLENEIDGLMDRLTEENETTEGNKRGKA